MPEFKLEVNEQEASHGSVDQRERPLRNLNLFQTAIRAARVLVFRDAAIKRA